MAIASVGSGADALHKATSLLAVVQLELESKGYPPTLVARALARARGTAEFKSAPIAPSIRGRAFLDLLSAELQDVESWLVRQQAFLEGQTIDDFEQERR